MASLVQLHLWDDGVDVEWPTGKGYNDFVAKFDRKKTTDDCYTPPEVYDVVLQWVKENMLILNADRIVRPFKPGGDYLAEEYGENVVVIYNPPFSIYSRIIENYERLGVLFFLFAPALTTFVKSAKTVSYIIAGCTITYANGAKVKTNFVTNLPDTPKIIISHDLKTAIENAQRAQKKTVTKTTIPAPYLSSAQLCKFANVGNFELNIKHEYITHNHDRRKIFGSAVHINENDYNKLFKAF